MPDTTIHQIPYPAGGDPPLGPAQMQALASRVDVLLPMISTTQPAHQAGLVWRNPNTGNTQISDGTAWFQLANQSALAPYPLGLVRVAGMTGSGANQVPSNFASASSYAQTSAYNLVSGRRYRIRCVSTGIAANYGSGNGVIWVAVGRTAGGSTTQLETAFQHPTKGSGVTHAVWAEVSGNVPGDIPAGSAQFDARVWGGAGVNYFYTTGRWTTTLEDLGQAQ